MIYPKKSIDLIAFFFLFFTAITLFFPVYQYPQTPAQQEDTTILRDKMDDLAEQVKDKNEQLALHSAIIAKQRFILVSLVLFAALSVASLTVIRIRAKARQKELKYDLIRTQQQALSRQMNPHFIFNTLGSLQSFILKNDRNTSNLYLTKFAQLMRHILDNLENELVDLEEEIKGLHLYIELQHMRFQDYFNYNISVDPQIDQTSIQMPPFLIQPYVENAICHGLLHRETKGNLTIKLKCQEHGILWIIEDDGIGRKEARKIEDRTKKPSPRLHGTDITRRRIDLLNTFTPDRYATTTQDLVHSNGKPAGTRVNIFIKSDIQ